jgi:hypothetical protein
MSPNAHLRVLVLGPAPWVAGHVDSVKAKPLVGGHETHLFDPLAEARALLELQPQRGSFRTGHC